MEKPRGKVARLEPAASLVIVRDGHPRADGRRVEVLMTERARGMDVAGGALVFPGGKIEHQDRAHHLRRHRTALDDIAFRLCAIREAFEETGILFARKAASPRHRGHRVRLGPEVQRRLLRRYRRGSSRRGFLAELQVDGLLPAFEALVPFVHWVTPEVRRRRFDTRFYLTLMPRTGQVISDGNEAVRAFWAAPEDLVDRYAHDNRTLMFPTRMTLGLLIRARTAVEAIHAATRLPVVPMQPRLERREEGIFAHLPPGNGFGGTVFPFELGARVPGLDLLAPQKA